MAIPSLIPGQLSCNSNVIVEIAYEIPDFINI